mgnify:CR=1 FL=1
MVWSRPARRSQRPAGAGSGWLCLITACLIMILAASEHVIPSGVTLAPLLPKNATLQASVPSPAACTPSCEPHGHCNADLGVCECPYGLTGEFSTAGAAAAVFCGVLVRSKNAHVRPSPT